jgi:hypothetical protein
MKKIFWLKKLTLVGMRRLTVSKMDEQLNFDFKDINNKKGMEMPPP